MGQRKEEGMYLGTIQSLTRIDRQAQWQCGKESYRNRHELGSGEDFLKIFALKTIVLGYEFHVIWQIRGVGALGLHVTLDRGCLARTIEDDG